MSFDVEKWLDDNDVSMMTFMEPKDAVRSAVAACEKEYETERDTLIQERDEARGQIAAAYIMAAGHQPMIAIDGMHVWVYCSCGFNKDRHRHSTDPADWSKHLRSLTPAGVASDAARALERKVLKAEYSGREAGHASKCQQCRTGNRDCWELLAIRNEGYKKLSDLQRQLDAQVEAQDGKEK